MYSQTLKRLIHFESFFLLLALSFYAYHHIGTPAASMSAENHYIKWVEFHVPSEVLNQAYEYDVNSYGSSPHYSWIELLAYCAAKNGGDFSSYKPEMMNALVKSLTNGETMESITKDMKYYPYYLEAYSAVLEEFVGEYEVLEECESSEPVWTKKYGLKAFHPIAKTFPYSDYDDFGVSRSYGYKRNHLGHDMMGQIGTPIICVESGCVEALGWNRYGGWRIGIRSFDKKRYYYYAHLRKDRPYAENLKEGDFVQAGDVIGYMGRTGYSDTENVNNIDTSHLHFGLQLIFDESQKDGNHEIWIDCYQLVRFLYKNQSGVRRNNETKEWSRLSQFREPEEQRAEKRKEPSVAGQSQKKESGRFQSD